MNLNKKVAIITGGTRGIGKGIAKELGQAGATVILIYKSDEKAAKETLDEFNSIGINAKVIKGDVSSFSFANNIVENIIEEYKKVDILVNNAAISKIGLLIDMNEEDYEEIINTNFKSVFNCTRAVLPQMLSRQCGIILNISSMWGQLGASCEVLYSASKGAIDSFTKALAKEVAPSGIRVNAISPGVIDTAMNQCFSQEEKNALEDEIALMRFGTCEEVGKAALFLCSDYSSYITGEILKVDGGKL
ncbi:elongation factor P 5-aminopentanone reductase [Clostridium cellulovorans]|uniref:Short-chain dehydrogenase/reductase SDR n=1 Tax=Clostridium cellulovorans (strain ATCC 35296 / DSM 3052 / OCM 3 / 743B) TaxID=573061 RepID=D9SWX2_CLOC7|nr:SDR family oxidoreductase [Clostridium cellulovorans]ADL51333.1 short-chain dehydrogenase/reductase SDR [Clostridium cellulovorans 743B]